MPSAGSTIGSRGLEAPVLRESLLKQLSSGNPESWRELPVEVIQHLLLVALRWAEADGHDTEVPPPDMIAKKNVLLRYQPLRLSDVVAWAWAGLRSPNPTITNAL